MSKNCRTTNGKQCSPRSDAAFCGRWYAFIATNRGGIHIIFFLFLYKNVCCGYSLEAPCQALLMSTHNICICREIRKISAFFGWKTYFICCYELHVYFLLRPVYPNTQPFQPCKSNQDTFATNVDPNEMAYLIRIYIVCHSVFDFWLTPLFTTMDLSKSKGRKSTLETLGRKGSSNRYVQVALKLEGLIY